MAKDIPLTSLALLGVFVVALSVLGTLFAFGGAPLITGYVGGNVTLWVNNTTSITLSVATVDFGTMEVSEQNDTVDGDAPPLILYNSGNVRVNVTVWSTSLWGATGYTNNTNYYTFNSTDNETDSSGGLADWTTFKNKSVVSANQVASPLSYQNNNDSIIININITVPSEEEQGYKQGDITFTAAAI